MFIKQETLSLSFRQHLISYKRSLSGNLWLNASLSAGCTALVVALCALLPKSFQATATICFSTQVARQAVTGWDSTMASAQFLATQARLMQADPILRPVVKRYRLLEREHQGMAPWLKVYSSNEWSAIQKSAITLRSLTITAVPGASCLNVTYSDQNPQFAADVANALANSFLNEPSGVTRDGTRSSGPAMGEAANDPNQATSPSGEPIFSPMVDEEWNVPNAVIRVTKTVPSLSNGGVGSRQEQPQPNDMHPVIKSTSDRTGATFRTTHPDTHMTQCATPAAVARQDADAQEAPVPSRGHPAYLNEILRFLDPAMPPAKPVFPNWPFILLACVCFFPTSIALCTVVLGNSEFISDDPDIIKELLRADVVAHLPKVDHIQTWFKRGMGGTLNRAFCLQGVLFDEGIRLLQNDILISSPKGTCQSILVTSALPGEGKTTIAVALAVGYAAQGKRTLLIDADLRCPGIEERLSFYPPGQLENVLAGAVPWKAALSVLVGYPKFSVLSSPFPLHNSITVVGGTLAQILDDPELEFDVIVIDAPPLLGCAESTELGAIAGVTLLCVRSGHTPLHAQKAALERLKHIGATFGGIVLNACIGRNNTVYDAYEKYYTSHAARQTEPGVVWPCDTARFSSGTLRR